MEYLYKGLILRYKTKLVGKLFWLIAETNKAPYLKCVPRLCFVQQLCQKVTLDKRLSRSESYIYLTTSKEFELCVIKVFGIMWKLIVISCW